MSVPRLVQAAFFAALGALWIWVTAAGLVSRLLLARPADVFAALVSAVRSGLVFPDAAVTLSELVAAFAIAAAAGVTVGYLVSRSTLLVQAFEPLIAALYAVPIIVFYPLCMLYLGLGPGSKIAYGAIFGFFPVALSTIGGLATVERRFVLAAQSMGASPVQMLRRVLIPAALPMIASGLRIGGTLTFLAIIGAETIGSLAGLGHRIVISADAMRVPLMYAFIVVVVAISAAFNWAASRLEARRARRGH